MTKMTTILRAVAVTATMIALAVILTSTVVMVRLQTADDMEASEGSEIAALDLRAPRT